VTFGLQRANIPG